MMPLTRDFAFVVDAGVAGGDLERALVGADRQLVASARVFDVYAGSGVPEGKKSVAVEVVIQPRDGTLGDAEIEALSRKLLSPPPRRRQERRSDADAPGVFHAAAGRQPH